MKIKYLILFWAALLITAVWADKSNKTGVVDKNIFTDSKYNYQFTIPANWKAKPEKEPSPIRAVLQKTKIERYGSASYNQTQVNIPSMFVCVETTSLEVDSFCKIILENPQKLPNSEIYLYKLEFLISSEVVDRGKIQVDGHTAQKIYLKKRYFKPVRDPRAGYGEPDNATLVEDFLLGFWVVFKKENNVIFLHCSGDREIFRINEEDWHRLLDSWIFISPAAATPQN